MKINKAFFVGAIALCSLSMKAQKAITLKFNPANGNKYAVTTSTKTKVAQSIMGQDMNMNMDVDMSTSYAVKDQAANKEVTLTYNNFKMSMDVMEQHVTINSDEPDTTNEASKAFKNLKGQTVILELDPAGKVVKVDASKLMSTIGDDPKQKEIWKGVLGEDALKTMLEQSFGFYPKQPVRPGDTWTSTFQLKQPYAINMTAIYTLKKVEGNKAFIDFTGTLATSSDAKMNMRGMEMTLELSGDITGSTEVDVPSGIPFLSNLEQKIKGNMVVQGQKIPMASSTYITTTMQRQ